MAIFTERPNGRNKTVHFGDSKMSDYVSGATKEQRERYRKRHQKDLRTNDPERAGFLSFYITWGESKSIRKNIESYKKRFNFK